MNDIKKIISEITENILEHEPLRLHTTFKTGGPARFFVSPAADELPRLIATCREIKIPTLIIGRGSNMLVSDEGFDGVVIHLGADAAKVTVEEDTVTAEAGASLIDVSLSACREGLTGFEFATGIPGSVGGAVIMNAGAYGGEIKQVIKSATAIMPDGTVKEF
nr:FAD-binding protein [Lachnospiraceae bacterium]